MKTVIRCARINNAGSNGYKYKTLLESSDADLVSIVETNVLGVMLGCKEVRSSAPARMEVGTAPGRRWCALGEYVQPVPCAGHPGDEGAAQRRPHLQHGRRWG